MRTMARYTGWGLGAAAMLFAGGFVVFASLVTAEPTGRTATADAIVALTGDEERIEAATLLLAEGRGKRLLISGVNRKTSRAALERLAPDSAGYFACCIDIDYLALDTIGNADETRAWVERRGFHSVIIVTSDYHMPRSLVEFGRAMPGVELIPHPTASHHLNRKFWWTSLGTTKLLMAEYLKLLPASARLAASRLFPASHSATAGAQATVRASAL